MKQYIFIAIFIFISFQSTAQNCIFEIDTIKNELMNFLVKNKNADGYKDSIYLFCRELIKFKPDNNNLNSCEVVLQGCGIYSFGIFSSHSTTHLLLLQNNQHKIINLNEDFVIEEVFEIISNYFQESETKISKYRQLAYWVIIVNILKNAE